MMKIPEIGSYTTAAHFFADFVALNQPQMSYRGFADAIGWPHSLLGDIVQERRGLSIARAVEFARYFEMTGVDTERLIILTLNLKMGQLREMKLIEGDLPEIKILAPNVGVSGMTRVHYFKTIEAIRPVVEMTDKLGHWRMSRLVFPLELYPELHQRIQGLVNWMQNQSSQKVDRERKAYAILQTNFLVTHLLDLHKLGLKIVHDPEFRHRIENVI